MTSSTINIQKKEKIDIIVSELLSDNAETEKINYGKRIGSLLNNSAIAIKYEWDDETILSEAIASFYESMINIADKYTLDEININNDSFMKEAYNKARYLMMKNLIDTTKHSKTIIKVQTVTLDDLHKEPYQDFEYETEKNENFFFTWFNDSKKRILTKKQNIFLESEKTSKNNKTRMKKTIYKKTMNACEKEFSTTDTNIIDIKYQLSIIEEILDSDNILFTLNKHKDKSFISNLLLNISINNRKLINRNSATKESIRELRNILYKEYNKLSKKMTN